MGWTNWAGSVACEPRAVLRPGSEAGVVEALAEARRLGARLRVAGSGHSFSPLVATDGLLLRLDDLAGVARADAGRRRAWVRAGTTLHALGEALHPLGLALENLGDVDVQALGGALATGTHGTGRGLPNLSARVSGVRLIGADGALRVVTQEEDPELLAAARVSLGALGVMTAARLELVPAYRLHERVERLPVEQCLEELDARIAASRHFEFFWLPARDQVDAKTLHPTAASPASVEGVRYQRIDWSHRVLPSVREQKFFEMEYALPAQAGPGCFRAVRERMRSRHPEVVWPVEYRTVKADDAWLSPAHGRATVTLSIHQDGALPFRELFADLEPLLAEHGGRPHWGKVHTRTSEQLAGLYPRFADFVRLRRELDPEGRFLNDHLAGLFGEPLPASPGRGDAL